jgi:hypothetical protein
MKASKIRAAILAPRKRNFCLENIPEETKEAIDANIEKVDSWKNWGYSTYDTYCRHCGALVPYNRNMLGEGNDGCAQCHPERWLTGYSYNTILPECPYCDDYANEARRALNDRVRAGQDVEKVVFGER